MFNRNPQISSRIRLRDSWSRSTNISPLAVLLTRERMQNEISNHLRSKADGKSLHERINDRADLYTTPYSARGWGYGQGNRAGRRLRLLWQEWKITGAVFSTLAPEIARRTYGIV